MSMNLLKWLKTKFAENARVSIVDKLPWVIRFVSSWHPLPWGRSSRHVNAHLLIINVIFFILLAWNNNKRFSKYILERLIQRYIEVSNDLKTGLIALFKLWKCVKRQWLLLSFLLDVVRLNGMDNPVLFWKVCCLAVKSKKTKVEKRIHIYGQMFRFRKAIKNTTKNSVFRQMVQKSDNFVRVLTGLPKPDKMSGFQMEGPFFYQTLKCLIIRCLLLSASNWVSWIWTVTLNG